MTRKDIHRPSEIKTEDYEFIALPTPPDYADAYDGGRAEFEIFQQHRTKTGGKFSSHEHGGTCHVCGASAKYLAIFYHEKTNTYIKVGQECAEKFECDPNRFKSVKRRCADVREARAGKAKAEAILSDNGLEKAWDIYTANCANYGNSLKTYEESTIYNIVVNLVKYGQISEKQIQFVKKLFFQLDNADAIAAQRKVEHEAASECPEGRVEIQGVLLSTKCVDSVYGTTIKCLIQADQGFKVWGTLPSDIFGGGVKGSRIKIKATVQRSKDDSKFGFYKRPILLEYVEKVENEATV